MARYGLDLCIRTSGFREANCSSVAPAVNDQAAFAAEDSNTVSHIFDGLLNRPLSDRLCQVAREDVAPRFGRLER